MCISKCLHQCVCVCAWVSVSSSQVVERSEVSSVCVSESVECAGGWDLWSVCRGDCRVQDNEDRSDCYLQPTTPPPFSLSLSLARALPPLLCKAGSFGVLPAWSLTLSPCSSSHSHLFNHLHVPVVFLSGYPSLQVPTTGSRLSINLNYVIKYKLLS